MKFNYTQRLSHAKCLSQNVKITSLAEVKKKKARNKQTYKTQDKLSIAKGKYSIHKQTSLPLFAYFRKQC